jgi:hypothetical protein
MGFPMPKMVYLKEKGEKSLLDPFEKVTGFWSFGTIQKLDKASARQLEG